MSADNVQVLRDAYAAFERQDIPAVLAAFDENISWTVSDTLPFGGTFHGHDGVLGFFGSLGEHFETMSVEPQEFIDGGDTVVVVVRDRATAAGGATDERAAHLWHMRDGRAVSFEEFADTASTLQVLGTKAAAAT